MSGLKGLSREQARVFMLLNSMYSLCMKGVQSWYVLFPKKKVKHLSSIVLENIESECLISTKKGVDVKRYYSWRADAGRPTIGLVNKILNRSKSSGQVQGIHEIVKEEGMSVNMDLSGATDEEKEVHEHLSVIRSNVSENPRLGFGSLCRDRGISQNLRDSISKTCMRNDGSSRFPVWNWTAGDVTLDLVKKVMSFNKSFVKEKNVKSRGYTAVTQKERKGVQRKDQDLGEKRSDLIRQIFEATGNFEYEVTDGDGALGFKTDLDEIDDLIWVNPRDGLSRVIKDLRDVYEKAFKKQGRDETLQGVRKSLGLSN